LADTKGQNYSCCQQNPEAFFVRRLQRAPFWVVPWHCTAAVVPLVLGALLALVAYLKEDEKILAPF
jgi:hypothetical protein